MALLDLPGSMMVPIGLGWSVLRDTIPGATSILLDASGESLVYCANIITSDGAPHTIDTTGSSSITWRTGTTGYNTAGSGSVFKVGLATVDTAAGPPMRAVNVADAITYDVSKTIPGAVGAIPSVSTQVSVPDAGSKTIANGDFVAICFEFVTRGGTDVVRVVAATSVATNRPGGTFISDVKAYSEGVNVANVIITFSDGALGYCYGCDYLATLVTRTWNSSSSPSEYGQLFQMPFGMKVSGLYGWADPDANFDMVLYSDPLGTPVAERTVFLDAHVAIGASARRWTVLFPSPYSVKPNQPIVAAYKPGATSISAYNKTISNAAYRITDAYGTTGYGVQRTGTGAFSDAGSSLQHYYIGLMASAFEEYPVQPTYALGGI